MKNNSGIDIPKCYEERIITSYSQFLMKQRMSIYSKQQNIRKTNSAPH